MKEARTLVVWRSDLSVLSLGSEGINIGQDVGKRMWVFGE